MKEYVIVGDVNGIRDCLIYVCGFSLEHAKRVLDRMLNNPTEDDKKAMVGHTNLKIREVNSMDCWWNYNCD